ncbi:hypothetical protein JRY02_08980 [Enterobacter roggenkampii]|nr:hypothetical protein [Enterobacter roggenkampii]
MTILEEVQNEAWFALVSIYTHQELMGTLASCPTRYEMGNQLIALNAIVELLILRIARLADRTKKVRNTKMLLEKGAYPGTYADVKLAAERFMSFATPIVKIRHEEVAHMKPGIVSTYGPRIIPTEALRATESLIELIDVAYDQQQSYSYRVGSCEPEVDLRASVVAGTRVFIK